MARLTSSRQRRSLSIFLLACVLSSLLVVGVRVATGNHIAHASSEEQNGDVLVIHGFNPNSAIDCQYLWGQAKQYAQTVGYASNQIKMIGFYRNDTNCDPTYGVDFNLYYFHEFNIDNICTSFALAHDSSDGGVGPNDFGTNNENLYFTGCKLNYFIYENYTSQGKYVQIVAHSMGGVLARIALHFAGELNQILVQQVVTISSPLGGIPDSIITNVGLWWFCNYCLEGNQLKENSSLMQDFAVEQVPPYGSPLMMTRWTLMGSFCDGFEVTSDPGVDLTSAMGLNSLGGIMFPASKRIAYSAVPDLVNDCDTGSGLKSYHHGDFLRDSRNDTNATVNVCDSCTGEPPQQFIQCITANHALAFIFDPNASGCSGNSGINPPIGPGPTPTPIPPTATPTPPPPTFGDFNGDRYADPLALYNMGSPSPQNVPATEAIQWLGKNGGITYNGQLWSSVGKGAFDWTKAKWVVGDFNGDGISDVIAMYNLGSVSGSLAIGAYEWLGTGSGLAYQGQIWSSVGVTGFDWNKATFLAGHFSNGHNADVMAMYDMGTVSGSLATEAIEWTSTGSGLTYQGQVWTSVGKGGFDWSKATFLTGDFNHDTTTDIMAMYNLGTVSGSPAVGAYEWLGTGSNLAYQGQIWSSVGLGGFDWTKAKWIASDFNGDGKTDVMAMYNLGTVSGSLATGAYQWTSTGSGLTYNGQVWSSVGRGGFDWTKATFLAANFNGDGNAAVLAMYNLGTVSGSPATGAYEWTSTGNGLSYLGQVWSSVGQGGFDWTKAIFLP